MDSSYQNKTSIHLIVWWIFPTLHNSLHIKICHLRSLQKQFKGMKHLHPWIWAKIFCKIHEATTLKIMTFRKKWMRTQISLSLKKIITISLINRSSNILEIKFSRYQMMNWKEKKLPIVRNIIKTRSMIFTILTAEIETKWCTFLNNLIFLTHNQCIRLQLSKAVFLGNTQRYS